MNDKVKTVGALLAAGALGAGLAFGGVALAMGDNFDKGFEAGKDSVVMPEPIVVGNTTYDLEAVEKLLNDADKVKDLSDEDLAELQEKYDKKVAELAKLDAYDDVISDEMDKDAAFAEVGLLLKGEDVSEDYEDMLDDLKDDLKDRLNGSVEDVDDLVWVKLLDNDEVEYDLDSNDDDELEGDLKVEVKVKFHEDGEDGDRHRETFEMEFEIEDGEVVNYKFEDDTNWRY